MMITQDFTQFDHFSLDIFVSVLAIIGQLMSKSCCKRNDSRAVVDARPVHWKSINMNHFSSNKTYAVLTNL